MIKFIRSIFESALKTNEHLAFSVITGCLRISKESIFTGLNNLKIVSILNKTFGESEVYNPWSVINYVDDTVSGTTKFSKPYRSNSSSNSIVRELVERADTQVRGEIESLLDGGIIEKPIHEEITYGDVYDSQDNLWNFLFFTGYQNLVRWKRAAKKL